VLTTHNRMLEAQITQKATFPFMPPDRLPSKPKPNSRERCNCVTMTEEEEDLTDPEDTPMEEGREIIMAENKERNNGKTATFQENDISEIPTIFPPKLPDPGSFSISCIMGKVEIKRGLCDLGASVSIMPYSLFHKLHLGPLLVSPFSLQLVYSSVTQPIGKLDNVPVNIGDIWVLKDFIIVDMPETDDVQIILGRPILATAGCYIDVREGLISFGVEGYFAVFSHRKEDGVSPHSFILDALPIFPEIDMEDVLNYKNPPDSVWISYEDPNQGCVSGVCCFYAI